MTSRYAQFVVLTLIVGVPTVLGQQSPAGPAARTIAGMEPLLARLAAFEHGQSRETLGQFTEFVEDAMVSHALLRQIEARLIRFVESKPTSAGRDIVLDQLAFVATEASIPMLVSLLGQAETAERARMVLERIPGPAAEKALREALGKATGNTRIGIINSIGRRKDAAAVTALAALIAHSDQGVTEAALAALATIANRTAVKAVASARTTLSGPLREAASEAYAECGDQLAKRGDKAAAVGVYRELITPRESAVVRVRALAGLAELEGRNAIPELTAAMHAKNRWEQAAGVAFLAGIAGAEGTKLMLAEFPKLSAPQQVRVLATLADRGDASTKPLVLAALKSNSGDVRAAGFAALGKLGDESSVSVLAEAASNRPGPEQLAARDSLWNLPGTKVDSAIVEGIGSKTGKVRMELIIAAGERSITSAAEALAKAVSDSDTEVQRAALRALRNVGGSAQVPVLIDAVLKGPAAADRREAILTLSTVLKRSQPGMIDSVVAAYRSASTDPARLSLLEVMGHSSNEAALPVLRSSLTDANSEVARGAILALTAWEAPTVHADLLSVAKNSSDPVLRTLALRGYIRQLGLPSQRPNSESARLLSEAMRLANDPAEKRSALSLLPSYPCQESLRLAEGALGDQTVANEAKVAVARLRIAVGLQ